MARGAAQPAVLRLANVRAGFDRIDPATNHYPGERAGLVAEVTLTRQERRQISSQNKVLALQMAAE